MVNALLPGMRFWPGPMVFAFSAGLCVAGCGNKEGDASVAACEAWLTTMVCGETDHRDEFDCQIYADQRCDVSPYFGCLSVQTECDEEASEFDFTGWDDCAVLATCAE